MYLLTQGTLQLSTGSTFATDLGLDSLDAVEVVMAIEEVGFLTLLNERQLIDAPQEFNIEIPDAEADAITTVQQGT